KTLPPPSGMSDVFARTVLPEPVAAFSPPPPVLPLLAVLVSWELDDALSEPPHAVSATASPVAPTAATTVRRGGAGTDWSDCLVVLTFPSMGDSYFWTVVRPWGNSRSDPLEILTASR